MERLRLCEGAREKRQRASRKEISRMRLLRIKQKRKASLPRGKGQNGARYVSEIYYLKRTYHSKISRHKNSPFTILASYQGCTLSLSITLPASASIFPSKTSLINSPATAGSPAPNPLFCSTLPPRPVARYPGEIQKTLTPSSLRFRCHSLFYKHRAHVSRVSSTSRGEE
jgi:hypothetical protein